MLGNPFDCREEVVLVVTADCGAWEQGDIGQQRQVIYCSAHPNVRGLAINQVGLIFQCAAERFLIINEDNFRTAAASLQCSTQTSRATTANENVAMDISLLVMLGVVALWSFTHAGNWANELLVEAPVGPHHRLVVERCREELVGEVQST
ncbi:hypothetical protein D3C84_482150 [compost metagenome]